MTFYLEICDSQENARKNIQSDEGIFSSTYENITATVRKDMKENFEVLSNKVSL